MKKKYLLALFFILMSLLGASLGVFTFAYQISDSTCTKYLCEFSNFVSKCTYNTNTISYISFDIKRTSSTSILASFKTNLSTLTGGIISSKTSDKYTINSTKKSITLPIQCVTNMGSVRESLYLIYGGVEHKIYDILVSPVTKTSYSSSETKKIENLHAFIAIKNGTFCSTGYSFDFSNTKFDSLLDLPYGKVPLKYFRIAFKDRENHSFIDFSANTNTSITFGIKKLDKSVYPIDALEDSLDVSGIYNSFYLSDIISTETKIMRFTLLKSKYLNETNNYMIKTNVNPSSALKEVHDIYLPFNYQNYYKGNIATCVELSLPSSSLFLRYEFPIRFNNYVYTEGENKTFVTGSFEDEERIGGKSFDISL